MLKTGLSRRNIGGSAPKGPKRPLFFVKNVIDRELGFSIKLKGIINFKTFQSLYTLGVKGGEMIEDMINQIGPDDDEEEMTEEMPEEEATEETSEEGEENTDGGEEEGEGEEEAEESEEEM